MRDLARRHRETVNLYVARDIYRVCVAQEESPQALRHVVRVGDELPLWAGASAKVLLRDATPAVLARIAGVVTVRARRMWSTLREWIDDARTNGFAASARRARAGAVGGGRAGDRTRRGRSWRR